MTEVEPAATPGSPAREDGGSLVRRPVGELSPVEAAQRRRNRRQVAAILVPAVILGAVVLIVTLIAASGGPGSRPTSVPPGYRAVSDGLFAYAVPAGWSTNDAYTDNVGDLDTQGRTGWVAEHVNGRTTAPGVGQSPPAAIAAFGQPRPTAYRLSAPRPVTLKGTTVAFRYVMTRPGGFEATLIDGWQAASDAEIWLVVHADAGTTDRILASFSG